METITLQTSIKSTQVAEYKQVLSYFISEYSLSELKKIKEKKFYMKMLDWVFNNEEKFDELKIKNWKIDFSDLLK